MNQFYSINPIGELYVPVEYRDAVSARGSVKLFAHHELDKLGRIFTHIQRGGVAVVQGDWTKIINLMEYVEQHKKELSNTSKGNRSKNNRNRRERHNPKQEREIALSKLMCWADKNGRLQVDPTPEMPFLLELIGENPDANQDSPFLVSIAKIQRIQSALEVSYDLNALNASLVASENVLAPRSQETIECFQEALQSLPRENLPSKPIVADVGCGSGCLTLLAHQELGESSEIYASDILSEATATTKINCHRILSNPHNVKVIHPGDLFDPFPQQQFDIIIFNAPWVVARVRNRSELAIHDEKQQTLIRFFEQVANYLKPDGFLLLGYADASGSKAIANLETLIEDSGFVCNTVVKRRVATHRSKRKWEHIQVYVLGRK